MRAARNKAAHVSFFLIKVTFVAIGPQEQTADPWWSSAHLVTDFLQIDAGAAFDNQLIMHRSHDETVPERLHGIGQNVAGDRLDNVFRDFRPVGFQPGPFAQVGAFVGHALGAEAIHADAGLDVGKPSAGGQVDEQHPALVVESEAM